MAARQEWNFTTDGEKNYNVVFEKNRYVSVNGSEPVKIAKIRAKENSVLENVYDVDLGDGQVAKLCVKKNQAALVYNGKDVNTGATHEIKDVPKWVYIFEGLYILNFFLIMGGALGVVVSMASMLASASIAVNKKMNTVVKILLCIILYVVVTIISYTVATGLTSLIEGL